MWTFFLDASKECLVLQHGLKTISKVSQATEEELMDCSLDHKTAKKIINFFENDCIQIWVDIWVFISHTKVKLVFIATVWLMNVHNKLLFHCCEKANTFTLLESI